MKMTINGVAVQVAWEENESVGALRKLVASNSGALTIKTSPYGGFELVGSFGTSLPRRDVPTKTLPGDVMLYSGNQIVVFFGSNSWSYTRLGKITDKTAKELAALFGDGDSALELSFQ